MAERGDESSVRMENERASFEPMSQERHRAAEVLAVQTVLKRKTSEAYGSSLFAMLRAIQSPP